MKDRQTIKKIVIGILLVALGVAWFGNAVDAWNFTLFFPGWWAALLMLCFLVSILSEGPKAFNVFFLVLFGAFVLKENGFIPEKVNFWLIAVALAVLVVGGKLIFEAVRGKNALPSHGSESQSSFQDVPNGDTVQYTLVSETVRFDGQSPRDGSYAVSFGSLTLDFTGAKLSDDAYFSLSVSFGEGKIILPHGVAAEAELSQNFASIKNKAVGEKKIRLKLSCAFGEITIVNP